MVSSMSRRQLTGVGRMLCYIVAIGTRELLGTNTIWAPIPFFADLTSTGTAKNSGGTARVLAVPSSPEPAATQDFCRKRDAAGR